MMSAIQDTIFKNRQPDQTKLAAYGFNQQNGQWRYQTLLALGFELTVTVAGNTVTTPVIDQESGLPYVLHLAPANSGQFVGQIRDAYIKTLTAISNSCFVSTMFTTGQMEAVINAIANQFAEHPEFLWAKFPNNAIVRRSDNRKWYALLVKVSGDKIGLVDSALVDVLVVRAPLETITEQVKSGAALPAYHMNKKHWLSYLLDAGSSLSKLMKNVATSRDLAK